MPTRININPRAIEARIQGAWDRGLAILSEEIKNDCNRYCKEQDGTLKMSSELHSVPDKGLIVWQTPYARRQYWAIRTAHTDKNPQASWKWCEVAKQKHKEQWDAKAQRLLEMNL